MLPNELKLLAWPPQCLHLQSTSSILVLVKLCVRNRFSGVECMLSACNELTSGHNTAYVQGTVLFLSHDQAQYLLQK